MSIMLKHFITICTVFLAVSTCIMSYDAVMYDNGGPIFYVGFWFSAIILLCLLLYILSELMEKFFEVDIS